MIGSLPKFLTIDNIDYNIDSDFRTALLIMQMYNDRALSLNSKHITMLNMLYTVKDDSGELITNIPDNIESAIVEAIIFLNIGDKSSVEKKDDLDAFNNKPSTIDYEKDEQILFPAVNMAAGKEVRLEDYLHWWTFHGYCHSIDSESMISTVISLRDKIINNKKLDKHEKEFLKEYESMVVLDSMRRMSEDKGEDYDRMMDKLEREKLERRARNKLRREMSQEVK